MDRYEVLHDSSFDNDLSKLSGGIIEGDFATKETIEILSRDPTSGSRIPNTRFFCLEGVALLRGAYIIYSLEQRRGQTVVALRALELTPEFTIVFPSASAQPPPQSPSAEPPTTPQP